MAQKAKFYKTGNVQDYTAVATKTAGDIVQDSDLAGMLLNDMVSGDLGSIQIRGMIEAKKDANAFTAGDPVYWDNDGTDVDGNTGGAATVVATGDFYLGRAVAAAGTADTDIVVDLNSVAAADANADITDSTAGTAAASLAEVEGTYTQATVADNFATLVAEQNAIKAALRASGILKP